MKSTAHRPWYARLLRRRPKPAPPLGRLAFDAFTGEYTSVITSFDGANHITFTETGLEAWHGSELRRHEQQVRAHIAQEMQPIHGDAVRAATNYGTTYAVDAVGKCISIARGEAT